ncbi:MAG: peptidoglycan editing factor PgeF [Longimonas sp.]|uniref:peptidoglycan editing factor PgeF n=1 Tax=Longimonas sp. TaxID=2039626 RepID=UPI00335F7295
MLPRSPVIRPRLAQASGLVAGFSTRYGGVSSPPYDSLNVGPDVDDAPEAVAENRRRVCDALGIASDQLARAGQVHGATVRKVDAPGYYPDCDALVTTTPTLFLSVVTADCAAVLCADLEAGVVAACHSGWRGTVAGILPNTLEAMKQQGATPTRIQAYISPCIGVDAFEVGPDVAAQFDEAVVDTTYGGRPHVDLKRALHRQLRAAGVPEAQIQVDAHCTASSEGLFSHRANGPATGRMMGVIGYRLDPHE